MIVRIFDIQTGEFVDVEEDITFEPIPELVPHSISDRQFYEQLANIGKISEDEALDAVSIGAIPMAISAFVDTLPEANRFKARMLLKGATFFERDHEIIPIFGLYFNMTSEEIDQLWIDASQL